MAFVPVPNVIQCNLRFVQEAQVSENTLYFEKSSAIVGSDFVALGDFLVDWWDTNLKSQRTGDSTLSMIVMADLSLQNGIGYEYFTGLPIAGTGQGIALPQNVAICVRFATGYRGRSYRGRNYLGGIYSNQVLGSTVLANTAQDIADAYDELITQTTLSDFTWVVVSRYENNQPRSVGVATPVLAASCDFNLDSQRRRLLGRGA